MRGNPLLWGCCGDQVKSLREHNAVSEYQTFALLYETSHDLLKDSPNLERWQFSLEDYQARYNLTPEKWDS